MGQPAADAGPTPTELILSPVDIIDHSREPEQSTQDEVDAVGRREAGDRGQEVELRTELNRPDGACHARRDAGEDAR